jgi:hypothetical protein
MDLFHLEAVVLYMSANRFNNAKAKVGLVRDRPQARLDGGDGHCLGDVLDRVNDRRSKEFRVAVVILHDCCLLFVGHPHPELPASPKVIVEAALETIAHSGFGPEAMTFTQIVAVGLLARQVPHDHVRVCPCGGDVCPRQFRSRFVQTVIRTFCVVKLVADLSCFVSPAGS